MDLNFKSLYTRYLMWHSHDFLSALWLIIFIRFVFFKATLSKAFLRVDRLVYQLFITFSFLSVPLLL